MAQKKRRTIADKLKPRLTFLRPIQATTPLQITIKYKFIMKPIYLVFAGLIFIGLTSFFSEKQSGRSPLVSPSDAGDHVIVSYGGSEHDIQVFYGGTRTETIKADKKISIQNSVIDVFDSLSAQGYSLGSTLIYPVPGKTWPQILCYFERRK